MTMATVTYQTVTSANAAVLPRVFDPHEWSITLPTSAGGYLGTAVGSLGVSASLVMVGNGTIDAGQFAAYFGASMFGGLGVGTFTSAVMVFKSWQFIRQMSTTKTETVTEEAEPWAEPQKPDFMPDLPSFVTNPEGGYRRVMHDLKRREMLMLRSRAHEGERFPTRAQLIDELGFANNAERISKLVGELKLKGIITENYLWTAQGINWLDKELKPNPPTPRP
jgi:hypothetical protein